MRKYFTIFKIAFEHQLEYRWILFPSFLFFLLPFGVNTLWVAVAMKNKNMLLGVNEILCYYFVTLIVSTLLITSCIFKISDDIRLGELSKYIIKPYHYILYQLMLTCHNVSFLWQWTQYWFFLSISLSRYMTFSVRIERIILMLFFLGMGIFDKFFYRFYNCLVQFLLLQNIVFIHLNQSNSEHFGRKRFSLLCCSSKLYPFFNYLLHIQSYFPML